MFLCPGEFAARIVERCHALTSPRMAEKLQEPAETQRTPKGLEIPVPRRKDLMDVFRKIVHTPPRKRDA
jgi:hypothetical protein